MNIRILMPMMAAFSFSCTAAPEQPVEVGKVDWQRDLDTALASSKDSGKPVFALFQEVPGCAGCKQFGKNVLSDPLVVDAIENEFTPLLIHNNQPGKDAEILKRFNEPAWNYQVVRFLDSKGNDLIPRKDKVWTTAPLVDRMIRSLDKAKRSVPRYLSILEAEQSPGFKTAAFSMHCFWTGEMKLGQIEGVVSTEAGFIGSHEVTLLKYDPRTIKLNKLVAAAGKIDCADTAYVPQSDLPLIPGGKVLTGYRRAPESDQKKQLSGTNASDLGLTPAQSTKLNAWLHMKPQLAAQYLSPPQRAAFRR
ncbi:VPGUxxT family thioredoxin-like (seleno)protein, type 2 [Haloferula sp.]|uniref:VPGUxxT family thioredoxin-like (seleno)protein, type 2 n=1 Tax=Haloferula sp. TaxID=2497595 RepID=UPI00329D2991